MVSLTMKKIQYASSVQTQTVQQTVADTMVSQQRVSLKRGFGPKNSFQHLEIKTEENQNLEIKTEEKVGTEVGDQGNRNASPSQISVRPLRQNEEFPAIVNVETPQGDNMPAIIRKEPEFLNGARYYNLEWVYTKGFAENVQESKICGVAVPALSAETLAHLLPQDPSNRQEIQNQYIDHQSLQLRNGQLQEDKLFPEGIIVDVKYDMPKYDSIWNLKQKGIDGRCRDSEPRTIPVRILRSHIDESMRLRYDVRWIYDNSFMTTRAPHDEDLNFSEFLTRLADQGQSQFTISHADIVKQYTNTDPSLQRLMHDHQSNLYRVQPEEKTDLSSFFHSKKKQLSQQLLGECKIDSQMNEAKMYDVTKKYYFVKLDSCGAEHDDIQYEYFKYEQAKARNYYPVGTKFTFPLRDGSSQKCAVAQVGINQFEKKLWYRLTNGTHTYHDNQHNNQEDVCDDLCSRRIRRIKLHVLTNPNMFGRINGSVCQANLRDQEEIALQMQHPSILKRPSDADEKRPSDASGVTDARGVTGEQITGDNNASGVTGDNSEQLTRQVLPENWYTAADYVIPDPCQWTYRWNGFVIRMDSWDRILVFSFQMLLLQGLLFLIIGGKWPDGSKFELCPCLEYF